ncbi:unnamed protein product [Clonostachys solani]|uniref:Uncharacterized protein n=1 Tax=Clonostachys solani TaxID=160281 RepID=A0A9P0ED82_9HYPO|nr:unnamed protein product [Clonostachys solani]
MGLSGEGLLAFEWTLIAVTIVLVVARLHLRFNYIGIGLVISDWFMFATLACNTALTCTDTYLYTRGVWSESIDYYIAGWVISENYELVVLKLRMSRAQKVSTSITFGLGIINIVVTFTRWFINQTDIGPDEDLATARE